MTELMFSLNATVPVFLLILLGFIICKIGIINDDFIKIANKFNFTITLPALLFKDLSSTDLSKNLDVNYILFCAIITSICFWGIWLLARLFIKDKTIIGAFVQASFRGSAAVLGIAFIQNIYGNSSIAPLMIIGTVPLYNIYSVIVLTTESNNGSKKSIKTTAINVLKNPIIISILAGLIFSALNLDFPLIIDKTINNVAAMASPLALICIGGAFKGLSAVSSIKPTLIATSIKLMILPALFLPIAVYFGYTDEKLVALIVMLASPTTPSCYIMAQTMGNDENLTASIVVVATLLSSVTLTILVYILKSLALI
jgi:predicted permease